MLELECRSGTGLFNILGNLLLKPANIHSNTSISWTIISVKMIYHYLENTMVGSGHLNFSKI